MRTVRRFLKWFEDVTGLWKIIPYDYRLSEIAYRLECWAYHRYSTVKPRYLNKR